MLVNPLNESTPDRISKHLYQIAATTLLSQQNTRGLNGFNVSEEFDVSRER